MQPWVRSSNGQIAGVCRSIADRLGLDPFIVRVFWLISVFCFGTGVAVYMVLAIALPREDKLDNAANRKILGVCSRVAKRTHTDVGVVRAVALGLAVVSLGTMTLLYTVLWIAFKLAENDDQKISKSIR